MIGIDIISNINRIITLNVLFPTLSSKAQNVYSDRALMSNANIIFKNIIKPPSDRHKSICLPTRICWCFYQNML